MKENREFPCGSVEQESGIVTAVALIIAVAQVLSLAQVLPYVTGAAKKINEKTKIPNIKNQKKDINLYLIDNKKNEQYKKMIETIYADSLKIRIQCINYLKTTMYQNECKKK